MAFTTEKSRNQQIVSAGMVAALHLGVGALLIATFAGGIGETIVHIVPKVFNVPPEPTPVPPDTRTPRKPDESVVIAPKPDITLGPASTDGIVTAATGTNDVIPYVGPNTSTGAVIEPSPTPTSSFIPRSAKPRTNPGTWATTLDYPARAIREGRQGVTAFRVSVGTDGKVSECMIIRSSGSQDLDEATCAKVSKRAKFEPATDANGNRVTGSYANSIRWELPE